MKESRIEFIRRTKRRSMGITPKRGCVTGIVALAVLFAGLGEAWADDERFHFVLGSVRVIYSTSGRSAVPLQDFDKSGVPDRVEDVARQVWAAREFFCGWLAFPDPFKSDRFGTVDCVQVSILAKERIGGLNGVAYRRSQKAMEIPGGSPDDRALVLAVANTVDPIRNPTPAHEFFHLIQYGATYFGNRWFLEGMARWSEAAWRQNGIAASALSHPGSWQLSAEEKEKLFGMSYEASSVLWSPLALLSEQATAPTGGERVIPGTLNDMRYSDGSSVVSAANLKGAALMCDILAELNRVDDLAKSELGYQKWTLSNQGAVGNDQYIYDVVMGVARQNRAVDD